MKYLFTQVIKTSWIASATLLDWRIIEKEVAFFGQSGENPFDADTNLDSVDISASVRIHEVIDKIASSLTMAHSSPEEVILKQDEPNDGRLFWILQANYEVLVREDPITENDTKKRILRKGDMFGEIANIFENRRTASVRSVNYGSYGILE